MKPTKDLLVSRLRTLAADYRLEIMPLKFRQTMLDAADEIERLRLATYDAESPLSDNGGCPTPDNKGNEDKLRGDIAIERLRLKAAHAELARLRLTAAERDAIEVACQDLRHTEEVATLRSLLERLRNCPAKPDSSIFTDAERLRDTPDAHATPGEVSVRSECTLTVAEREAVEGAIEAEHRRGAWKWAETLRGLLERL